MTITHINNVTEFHNLINNDHRTIFVKYSTTRCAPCRALAPVYEEYAGASDEIVFAEVDAGKASDVAQLCGISAVPTIQIYLNKIMLEEIVGVSKTKLGEIVRKYTK